MTKLGETLFVKGMYEHEGNIYIANKVINLLDVRPARQSIIEDAKDELAHDLKKFLKQIKVHIELNKIEWEVYDPVEFWQEVDARWESTCNLKNGIELDILTGLPA